MKKYLLTLLSFITVGCSLSFGQFFSATASNNAGVITFSIKPDANVTTNFSTIEFFLIYPAGIHTVTYGTAVVNTTNFPGMSTNQLGVTGQADWEIEHNNAAYAITGYDVDHFVYTAPSLVTTSTTYIGGTEYPMVSFTVNGVANTDDFKFVSGTGDGPVYCALTSGGGIDLRALQGDGLTPVYSKIFYPNTNSIANPSGGDIYFSALLDGSTSLPVKFTNFSATKKADAAILTWQIENESATTVSYVVERSLNGVDFTSVTTVAAKNNGSSLNSYEISDNNLSSLNSSGVLYYRVKQVDVNGKFVYTSIKSVRLSNETIINVYPNPVKNTTNLSFDLSENQTVIVTLADVTGKEISKFQHQGIKGLNTKVIDMSTLSAGTYTLKLHTNSDIKTIPVIKSN
jgi:hypothetical protein